MLLSHVKLCTTLLFALAATLAPVSAIEAEQLVKRQLVGPALLRGKLVESLFDQGPTFCGQNLDDGSIHNQYILSVNYTALSIPIKQVCGFNLTLTFANGRSVSAKVLDICKEPYCQLLGSPHLYEVGGPTTQGYHEVSIYFTP